MPTYLLRSPSIYHLTTWDTLGVTSDKFQAATAENFRIMAHSTYQAGGERNAGMQPLPFPGCL